MNSFIQALHLCSDFRQKVLDFEINRILVQIKEYQNTHQSKPNLSLLLQLQKLFALLSFSKRQSINTAQFRMTLPDQFKNNFNQHDANEFGKILLDEIETALKKLQIYEVIQLLIQNLIKESFQGQIEWVIECMECHTIVRTKEDILDLNLSIPNQNQISLEQLIEENSHAEIMDGDNKYQCDNCGAKTVAKRHFEIKETANNFIISLNRFDFRAQGNSKILTNVEIPDVITINHRKLYIQAVVVHSGPSMNYGHYFTLSRYFLMNDEQICQYTNIQAALNNLLYQQTPYILFYKTDYPYQQAKIKSAFLKNIIDIDSSSFQQQQQQQQQQQFIQQQQYNNNSDKEDDDDNQGGMKQNRMIF